MTKLTMNIIIDNDKNYNRDDNKWTMDNYHFHTKKLFDNWQ